jgi:hypothetical protein
LPLAVECHLRGPQARPVDRHAHEDMVGLLPVDDRDEPLVQAQPVPARALADGHACASPSTSPTAMAWRPS